jgi:hypothetical protein
LLAQHAEDFGDQLLCLGAFVLGRIRTAHVRPNIAVAERKVVITAAGLGCAVIIPLGNLDEMVRQIDPYW